MQEKTIHEGRNVKRLREILRIKQETLAFELGLSQQTVSALEQKEALDKDMLEKIANIMKIPVEAIKNFDEEAVINNVSCNFHESPNSASVIYNFNSFDKYIETLEENKRLYEARLKDKDEMIAMLQKLVEKK